MDAVTVLILGGGIAGASCAWHLRRRLGSGISMRVLEAAPQPGGRVREIDVGGERVEAGATLIHSSNRCLVRFCDEFGLDTVAPHRREQGVSTVVIWDGEQVLLRSGGRTATLLAMLRRYGITPYRAGRRVRETIRQWEAVYPALEGGAAFPGTRDLFTMLGLAGQCAGDAYNFYRAAGLGERFVAEFIDGVSRINYGQCGTMNAFASQVSLAGAGLAGGSLFSVAGGNVQLCSRALQAAGVDLQCGVRALAVRESASGCVVHDGLGNTHRADHVVIACPAEVEADGHPPLLPGSHTGRAWQATHATFVCGNLTPGALPGLNLADPPDTVLTPEVSGLPLTSLGRVGHSARFDAPIWKLFSREPLAPDLINRLFVHAHQVERIPWRAYPVLSPRSEGASFRHSRRIYDASAMEEVVSTMETQALSGFNVANLIAQQL